MPEYEYRCKKCEQAFIIERSMSDASAAACVHCGSENLTRVWTASVLSGKAGSTTAGTAPSAGMCATNPSKPKNCCPCG